MKGIETYRTKSGYAVAKIHYTADPDKDPSNPKGMDWLKRELNGYKGGLSSSAWRKEMEIDFKARSGNKVFEGLELMRDKIMIRPFSVAKWLDVRGGYDWGKRNPFAYIEGTVDKETKYLIYGAGGSGIEIHAQAQMIKQSPHFKSDMIRYADPSIWTEDQVAKDGSYTSFQRVFQEHGIHFTKGNTDDIAFMERLEMEWFDIKVTPDGKIIKVPKDNPTLKIFETLEFVWESLVNLRWSEFSPSAEENKGKKEEIAHAGNDPWDAMKYWYLSLPKAAVQPKPKSSDSAEPLAGELLMANETKSKYDRWKA